MYGDFMIYTKKELLEQGLDETKIETMLKNSQLYIIENEYYSDTQIYSLFDLAAKKRAVATGETGKNNAFFIGFFG